MNASNFRGKILYNTTAEAEKNPENSFSNSNLFASAKKLGFHSTVKQLSTFTSAIAKFILAFVSAIRMPTPIRMAEKSPFSKPDVLNRYNR